LATLVKDTAVEAAGMLAASSAACVRFCGGGRRRRRGQSLKQVGRAGWQGLKCIA
jgi:hypothetical protein